MMKKQQLLLIVFFLFTSASVFSQQIWAIHKDNSKIIGQELEYRTSNPTAFEIYSIDNDLIDKRLNLGFTSNFTKKENSIELPTPNGVQRFLIKEASVLSAELAAKFPAIKSYSGIGIDDPTARVRLSKSPVGLHAMITSGNYPMYLIDPYTKDKNTAIAYYKNSSLKSEFECLVEENIAQTKQVKFRKTANANDGKLRTYKLALIATAEYSDFHLTNQGIGTGETDATKKAAVLAAMNTSITRINGVFERDLGVAMQLVANNADLIFLNPSTDGLTNNDIEALIDESQTKCDAVIGTANYDIGHVFAWVDDVSGNGLAGGGVVCDATSKGQGVSMKKSPIGDTFDIDLAAHEIGHQFGANHTQNGDCNRNNSTAVEPGSGSTIMGYAGFCDPEVQGNSDAYFHAVSIAEMWDYVSTITCAVETATNNTAPVANAGGNYTIPKSTPFVLIGSATDADAGNSLTYNWEQIDNETATMPPLATNTVGPMFRSFSSRSSSNRYMPAIETVLAGNTSTTWEVLPSVARTLNFALTVRDNVVNGAATDRDDTIITVDASSGPFTVSSQTVATTLNGDSTQTITWNVANTTAAPVSCANVNILLSIDGGLTYPHVLVSNTLNDGSQDVVLVNITTTQARIKIEPVNNIFYAVNSVNFSIDKTTSVNDELFTDFNVYPNPSKGNITVSFDIKSSKDKVVLKLFDIRGRMIDKKEYKITSSQFKKELDYQAIAKGLYILKIENGENRISKKILID